MADPINALVEYITNGSRVMQQSIALEIGGKKKEDAEAFFALRDAFDIRGYMDAAGAEKIIREKLQIGVDTTAPSD